MANAKRFARDLMEEANIDKVLADFTADVARQVGTAAIINTPVDTGNLIANWLANPNVANNIATDSNGLPSGSFVPREPVESAAVENLVTSIVAVNPGDKWVISNNARYAVFVNDGSPTTSPSGMVELAVAFGRTIRRRV